MSSLYHFSDIVDLDNLTQFLFEDKKNLEHIKTDDVAFGWDSDWGWEDVNINSSSDGKTLNSSFTDWLHDSIVAISPVGDVLCIGRNENIIILKYGIDIENGVEKGHFKPSFLGKLSKFTERTTLTSLLCVPIASQRQSSHGSPDWTCVIVGYDNGCVGFYTETGEEVMLQWFHDGSENVALGALALSKRVESLRLATYEPGRFLGDPERSEELSVLYSRVIVIVEGFPLYQILRARRNQLARVSAGSDTARHLQTPVLTFKKWNLQDQESICDSINVGVVSEGPFDQLQTASLLGGPYATVKIPAPVYNLFVTSGANPCLGFYYGSDDAWRPVLTDVAIAVASKVKSALFSAASSWFGSGRSGASNATAPLSHEVGHTDMEANNASSAAAKEPAVSLTSRFGLSDRRRETSSLTPASHCSTGSTMGPFGTSVDNFGRVMLLDLRRGCVLRMWKGYRDAQTAWLQVPEEKVTSRNGSSRLVLFLILYAPRRGLLEVWLAPTGPRIAAFNVCRKGCLFNTPHSLLGLNAANYRATMSTGQLQTAWFLEANGTLRTFDVPFHVALSSRDSLRSHDTSLLKRLRAILREPMPLSESEELGLMLAVKRVLQSFCLIGFLEQAVERLLAARHLTVTMLQSCLSQVLTRLGFVDVDGSATSSRSNSPAPPEQQKLLNNPTQLTGSTSECRRLAAFCRTELVLLKGYMRLASCVVEDEALLQEQLDVDEASWQSCLEQLSSDFAQDKSLRLTRLISVAIASNHAQLNREVHEAASTASNKSRIVRFQLTHRRHDEPTLADCGLGWAPTPVQYLGWFFCAVQPDDVTCDDMTTTMTTQPEPSCMNWSEKAAVSGDDASLPRCVVRFQAGAGREDRALVGRFIFASLLADDTLDSSNCTSIEPCLSLLDTTALPADLLTEAFAHYWLSCDVRSLLRPSKVLLIHHVLQDLLCRRSPSDSQLLRTSSTLRSICEESDQPMAALLLGLVATQQLLHHSQRRVMLDAESAPALVQEVQVWRLLIRRLYDCSALAQLLTWKPTCDVARLGGDAEVEPDLIPTPPSLLVDEDVECQNGPVTVRRLLNAGCGLVTELIARWVVRWRLSSTFIKLLYKSITEAEQSYEKASTTSLFDLVYAAFPFSLFKDNLFINAAWEYGVAWSRDPALPALLSRCTECLHSTGVPAALVRQGLASMLWEMHLRAPTQAAVYLLQRSGGRAPRDRLLRKETNMGVAQLPLFFFNLQALLMEYMQACTEADSCPLGCVTLEDAWKKDATVCANTNTSTTTTTTTSRLFLVELAADQPRASIDALRHHVELIWVCTCALMLDLRNVQPLSLFDTRGVNSFFGSLSCAAALAPSASHRVDLVVEKARRKFLSKGVAAVAERTRVGAGNSSSNCSSADLMQILEFLSLNWHIEHDWMICRRLVEFYSAGLDQHVERFLSTVDNSPGLGAELLLVAGRRIALACLPSNETTLDGAQDMERWAAKISPALLSWLRNCYPDKFGSDVTSEKSCHTRQNLVISFKLNETAGLLAHVMNLLSESQSEYRIAVQLVDLVQELISEKEDNV